jgi:serine protease AprX
MQRDLLEKLVFGDERQRRFTQDSPILPDVWLAYADQPNAALDLLITPHRKVSAGQLSLALERRLREERKAARPAPSSRKGKTRAPEGLAQAEIAHTQGNVVARLRFDELIRVVLPMTPWWQENVWRGSGEYLETLATVRKPTALIRALEAFPGRPPSNAAGVSTSWRLSLDLIWMARVVGSIRLAQLGRLEASLDEKGKVSATEIAGAVAELISGLKPPSRDEAQLVWLVSQNRRATAAVRYSTLAVKADAARRLFEVSCRDVRWAVVDSGIDARHPAFRAVDPASGKPYGQAFEKSGSRWINRTRIVATYDFSRVRQLLNPSRIEDGSLPQAVKSRLEGGDESARRLRTILEDLKKRLMAGCDVDWSLLEPFLRVPHDDKYLAPRNTHGTHVAGILAARWPDEEPESPPLEGMCPDMEIYDLRVLDDDGEGSEFGVIAALQFVRFLNAHRDHFVVHGANLSLSILHEVANYACGSTPVWGMSRSLLRMPSGGGVESYTHATSALTSTVRSAATSLGISR